MIRAAIVILALSLSPLAAATQPDSARPIWTFYTGQSFLEIETKNPDYAGVDTLYVSALSDALNILSTQEGDLAWVPACTTGKHSPQLTAIFKKWLNANPERWHENAASLFVDALKSACKVG